MNSGSGVGDRKTYTGSFQIIHYPGTNPAHANSIGFRYTYPSGGSLIQYSKKGKISITSTAGITATANIEDIDLSFHLGSDTVTFQSSEISFAYNYISSVNDNTFTIYYLKFN